MTHQCVPLKTPALDTAAMADAIRACSKVTDYFGHRFILSGCRSKISDDPDINAIVAFSTGRLNVQHHYLIFSRALSAMVLRYHRSVIHFS